MTEMNYMCPRCGCPNENAMATDNKDEFICVTCGNIYSVVPKKESESHIPKHLKVLKNLVEYNRGHNDYIVHDVHRKLTDDADKALGELINELEAEVT